MGVNVLACITKQRVGKYVYLYESVSYLNAEKKVRNRKTRIGKIDVSTGNPVFDEEYINRLKTEGKKLPDVKQEPVQTAAKETNGAVDIALKVLDGVKDYGSYYLLEQISKKSVCIQFWNRFFQKHGAKFLCWHAILFCPTDR